MNIFYKIAIIFLVKLNKLFFRKPKLSILIYHRVLEIKDDLLPDEVDKKEFEGQLHALSKYFHLMTLSNAMELLPRGDLPPNALCITFDDGYENNYTVALPVLQKHRAAATFFISSGYLDGGIMWNDVIIELIRNVKCGTLDLTYAGLSKHDIDDDIIKRRELLEFLIKKVKHLDGNARKKAIEQIIVKEGHLLPSNLMMTSEQVKSMRGNGMEIGGHTISHPILAKVNLEQARIEIGQDKEKLEEILGEKIYSFAYPNGKKGRDYLDEHAEIVKELGYRCAVSTDVGITQRNTNSFQLPRYTPWDKDINRYLIKLILNVAKN